MFNSPMSGFGGLADDDFLSTYAVKDLGGISLDPTLTLLNDVKTIRGAAYDVAKGKVVFVGEGTVPVAEKIDMDDLVVAPDGRVNNA